MNNRNQHSKSWTHCVVLGSNPNDDNVSLKVDESHHLKTVDTGINKRYYTGKVLLTSSDGVATYADTLPAPQSDSNSRSGWLHHKTVANTDKLNYYFYSQGSIAIKLKEITNLKAIISVDNYTNTSSVPFFVVYTKPTGVGDAGAWYHSKRAYTLTAGQKIMVGERIQMYAINKGSNLKSHRQVEFNQLVETGDLDPEEEVLTISIQTDSDSPINTKTLVKAVGYLASGIEINLELD
tara:strand:- start:2122 stop:2832 length:711 start_codon:yes stop_codon:yes gene_type:complete